MSKANEHLKKYPKCRGTTLAMIEAKCAMTDRLRKENEQARHDKAVMPERSRLMRWLEWFK